MNAPSLGTWLILGVVFSPVYLMLAGWFFGRPREIRMPVIGLGLMIGLTALAWGGMALFAILLDLVYF